MLRSAQHPAQVYRIFSGDRSRAIEFSQVPFWFWNDALCESELVRQLDDFQAHGVHAVVIHPRAGLPLHLGWMSDAFLRYMRFAIEQAAQRDMWIILYDEAMYPSGSSAGQVVAENPDYRPISDWCDAHGIALTGHPEKSDDIAMLRHFQIPGQDVVWRYVEPGKASALEGPHSTMGKCASSAMLHLGRRRNLNEFAGAYGHDLSFETYRWLALWLLLRGCNMLAPHAFYYSIRGPRIDERPRDVGPNSPWWAHYGDFAELTGTLCWLNTDCQHICNVAILGQDDRLPWEAARVCFETQIDFNYLEDYFLVHDAEITDDGISVGDMFYDLLIVEHGFGTTLGVDAEAVIERLEQAGRVLRWGPAEGREVLLEGIARIVPNAISVTPAFSGLRLRRVRKGHEEYLVVFNECDGTFQGRIQVAGVASGLCLEMDRGEVAPWNADETLKLGPHDCVVLMWTCV